MKLLLPLYFTAVLAGDKNGGGACAACGILGSWLEQYASANGKSGEGAIRDLCSFLPTELDSVCNIAVRLFADSIQAALDDPEQTTDTVCHCLGLCFVTEGYDRTCHLHAIPDYAVSNPTEKCPKWTQDTVLKKSARFIHQRNWSALLDLIKENAVINGYGDILDDIIYKFGELHQ